MFLVNTCSGVPLVNIQIKSSIYTFLTELQKSAKSSLNFTTGSVLNRPSLRHSAKVKVERNFNPEFLRVSDHRRRKIKREIRPVSRKEQPPSSILSLAPLYFKLLGITSTGCQNALKCTI